MDEYMPFKRNHLILLPKVLPALLVQNLIKRSTKACLFPLVNRYQTAEGDSAEQPV